jgi:hypothetical protein
MRQPHHRSFLLAVAVLVTAAIVVAAGACHGGSGDDRSSADSQTRPVSGTVERRALVRALEATRAVESGRVEVATALTGFGAVPDPPPGDRLVVARCRVAFDRRARRVQVEVEMSAAAAGTGTPDAALGNGEAALGAAVSSTARVVAAGGVVYTQAGPMAAALGRAPGDWVKADRAAFAARGVRSDAARLLLDPLGPFEVVGDAIGDARVVGHDLIRGSPATHLAASADLGASVAPIEVWIDSDGVIRRLEIRLGGHAADGPGAVATTAELYDIGRAVDIAVPALAGGER